MGIACVEQKRHHRRKVGALTLSNWARVHQNWTLQKTADLPNWALPYWGWTNLASSKGLSWSSTGSLENSSRSCLSRTAIVPCSELSWAFSSTFQTRSSESQHSAGRALCPQRWCLVSNGVFSFAVTCSGGRKRTRAGLGWWGGKSSASTEYWKLVKSPRRLEYSKLEFERQFFAQTWCFPKVSTFPWAKTLRTFCLPSSFFLSHFSTAPPLTQAPKSVFFHEAAFGVGRRFDSSWAPSFWPQHRCHWHWAGTSETLEIFKP